MNIVVLDGYSLNPGDLSWDELNQLGKVTLYDRTPKDLVCDRVQDADIILTNKTQIYRETIESCNQLKFISILATGINIVDIDAAREHGIPVSNVPDYGTKSVAQCAFAHLLNFTHHIAEHSQASREGQWVNSPDYCFWNYPLIELDGLTLGIVGFGRIGRMMAEFARPFGMNILAYDSVEVPPMEGVELADLKTVMRKSDFISLHTPLTPETRGMFNAEILGWMKPGAFLINTGRGPVIDEEALADALNTNRIAGAGLDVLSKEPPAPDNPLLTAKNCVLSPHIAWATHSARVRLMKTAVDNIRSFLEGKPQHVVNSV